MIKKVITTMSLTPQSIPRMILRAGRTMMEALEENCPWSLRFMGTVRNISMTLKRRQSLARPGSSSGSNRVGPSRRCLVMTIVSPSWTSTVVLHQ